MQRMTGLFLLGSLANQVVMPYLSLYLALPFLYLIGSFPALQILV
jgi:hypothetical protein